MRKVLVSLAAIALFTGGTAQADSTVVLGNNVLHLISLLTPTGATSAMQPMSIGVGLAGQNPSGEQAYLAAEYNPASPYYQQFLDPDSYEQSFGVPADRFNATVAWLQSGGLTVQTIPGVSEYILASGTAGQVQGLLGVTFANYHIDAGDFFANTNAPTVPASLGVTGITGLNNFEGPRIASKQRTSYTPAAPSAGMDMNLTAPTDLWSIYNQPSNNKGEGQQLAIFGWGTTNNTLFDLRSFEAERQLPAIPVSISYFGPETAITDSGGEEEWNIDTQASTGMAPNATALKLYFAKAGTDADLLAAYNAWAADKQGPLQGSSSFGGCEEAPEADQAGTGNANQDLYEAVLRRAVIEGRTMFASSGDSGAGCPAFGVALNGVLLVPTPWLNYPSVSPNAVSVGGTVLYWNDATALTPASRALEYSWNYTGGGSSQHLAAGSYQQSFVTLLCATDPHGNAYVPPVPCRGIPDVASQSGDIVSNGYMITVGGKNDQSAGGTSLSSPLWLGMWTRIQAAASKKGNGFANYALYKHPADFFDVGGVSTETTVTCNGEYCSHPGWDYTSGLGVPNVAKLMLDVDGRTAPTHLTKPNAPPILNPAITGTSCPGPQIVDAINDAPNAYTGGDGTNMDNLDIVSVAFTSPNPTTLRVTMTIKNLQAVPPPVNLGGALWAVFWTYNGTTYYVRAQNTGAAFTFDDGTYTSNFNAVNSAVTGTTTTGANGTFVMDVPLADIGNPAAGATLTFPFAESHGSLQAVYYTAAADRAPDLGFGASWTIGTVCP